MAKITDLFDRYSEEFLANNITGKIRGKKISDLGDRLPLDLELMAKDNDGLVFQTESGDVMRIMPDNEIDHTVFEARPKISGLYQLTKYDKEAGIGTVHYLLCGLGQCFEDDIKIGYSPNYIASRRLTDLVKLSAELKRTFVFESSLGCYILEENYPDSIENKTLHGEKFAADLYIKEQKYILNKHRKKSIGDSDNFRRYRLARYHSIEFVEENNAKAILNRIIDKATNGTALLNIWTLYSKKELEKAEFLSNRLGLIRCSEVKGGPNHVKKLKLDLTEEQTAAFKELYNDIKNSSFEIASCAGSKGNDIYTIRDINMSYNYIYVDVIDEDDTLGGPDVQLVLSTRGDIYVQKRRTTAYQDLLKGGKTILRNLLFAIEDEAAEMVDYHLDSYKKPLTDRTRTFLKERFGISDLTENQKKAIEIALNTPDIAVIQGPPGTGKSTVIAAICDRLFEEADKTAQRKNNRDRNDSSKLILASAFQNDTVEHIASKIENNGLPAVKIGKDATTESAEQIVSRRMIEAIDKALQYYANNSTTNRMSVRLKKIRDVYIKEHNLETLKESIDSISNYLNISDELRNQWRELSKPFRKRIGLKDDKRIKALRNLSTDVTSYDDNGYMEVRRLLRSGLCFTDEEKSKLKDAPFESPSQEFLDFLSSIKEKYLNELDTPSNAADAGNNESILDWLEEAIKFEKNEEENAYTDTDTFISANLEALREELEGESKYIRESILAYSESVAATNQKAGSKEMPGYFQNVILEEAARSNPLDLLIPMTKAQRRIILVGDQKQLPQLIENDIVEEIIKSKKDSAEREFARKQYESSLFGLLFNNLQKAQKKRFIRLNEQFRMHPAIGDFISRLYYDDAPVKAGLPNQAHIKAHGLKVNGLKDKTIVFCDVPHDKGQEKGRVGKSRVCEARRAMELARDIFHDPASKNLSIGVITFYAAQRDRIFSEAEALGFVNSLPNGDYEIGDNYKHTKDGREKLRIGTVDSFQGKEFDVVILSTTRSNQIERTESNVRKVFGFLTSENRLNVAFSRAQRLLIVCGDGEMFNDDYARTYVKGLYEFYVNETINSNYGARII